MEDLITQHLIGGRGFGCSCGTTARAVCYSRGPYAALMQTSRLLQER